MHHSERLGDLAPNFDECPVTCHNEGDVKRTSFCVSCPQQELEDEFREAAIHYLNEQTGNAWRRYGLDLLLSTLYDVIEIEKDPAVELTLPASRLVSIVRSERKRKDRVAEWNKKQQAKNPRQT